MAEPDIRLVIGVEQAETVSEIEKGINEALKKVSIDTSQFGKQIGEAFEKINKSGKFSVQVSKLTLGAGAVSDFKQQVQSVINTLRLDKGTSITISAEGIGQLRKEMKGAGEDASEAIKKMADLKVQQEALNDVRKQVHSAVNTLGDNAAGEDSAQVQELKTRYEQLAAKIHEANAAEAANPDKRAEIEGEARAILDETNALIQKRRVEEEDAQSTAKRARQETDINALRQRGITLLTRMQKELRNSTKAESGKSSASFKAIKDSADELSRSLANLVPGASLEQIEEFKTKLNAANFTLVDGVKNMKSAGENSKTFLERMGVLGKKFGEWLSVSRIVMAAWRAIKQMVSATIELDSALTQLKIVTGSTDAQMRKFLTQATTLAKGLGKSISDIVSSIEVFSRLGYNLSDSSTLAKYAAILSNVAAVGQDEATTGITSIIKGYNMDVGNAEHVADVLVQVGQKYAVSASEMMEAYEKSGAALNATNTSFEKSAGLIAAANASVQNASTVGTALKTVSARIRGSKSELSELGEDAEELVDGFSKYADELKALTGFDIMENLSTGTFKDIYDIFGGISQVWSKLSDTQQARVAEILGGTRQLQVISSIIGNWGDAANAYADAMDAAGVATQANAIYMESVNGHITQFKAAFQDLSYNLISKDIISDVVDLGTGLLKILNAVTNLINAVGGLRTVLVAVVGVIATRKINAVYESLKSIQTRVSAVYNSITSGTALAVPGTSKLSAAIKGLGISATTAQIAVAALFAALTVGIMIYNKVKQAQEENRREMNEAADAANEERKSIDELIGRYEALAKAGDFDHSARETAKQIQSDIAEIVGEQADNLDLVNGKLDEEIRKLDEIRYKTAVENKNVLYTKADDAEAQYNKGIKARDSGTDFFDLVSNQRRLEEYLGLVGYTNAKFDEYGGIDLTETFSGKNAEEVLAIYEDIQDVLLASDKWRKRADAAIGSDHNAILNDIQDKIDFYKGVIGEFESSQVNKFDNDAIIDLHDYLKKTDINSQDTFDTFVSEVKESTEYSEAYKEVLIELARNTFPEFSGASDTAAGAVGTIVNEVKEVSSSLSQLNGFKDAYGTLSAVVSDISGNGRVLFSTLSAIGEKFADVDGIDSYIDRLAHLRENGEDANKVLNELMMAYLGTGNNAKALAGASKDVVASMLREIGVTNASTTAEEMLAYAKARVAVDTAISEGTIESFSQRLDQEAKAAGVTQEYMVNLAASMITAENTTLSFRDQISALGKLYTAAGMVEEKISSITGKMTEEVKWMKHYGFTDAEIQERLGQITSEELNARFESSIKAFGGNFKSSSSSSKKETEAYLADIDRLYKRKEDLSRQELKNERLSDNLSNTEDLKKRIALQDQLIDGYKEEERYLHELAGSPIDGDSLSYAMDTARGELLENLGKLRDEYGLTFDYDPETNELLIHDLEKINELTVPRNLYKSGIDGQNQWQEAVNERIKGAENLVSTILDENKAIQEWSGQWWDNHYKIIKTNREIVEGLKEIVEQASESVDTVQNVYSTLQAAADEYAKNDGFISVDTFQSIVALGPEYMQYITDENGLLVLNRKAIQDVIRAKTEQLALENALSYVERIRRATSEGAVEDLNQLVYAQDKYTEGQWAHVYATLEELGLTKDQYEAAKHNIDVIRQLCIGVSTDLDEVTESIENMRSGIDKILQWTMDMLKKRVEDEIDSLEELKDAYGDLIDKRKEAFDTAKQEADYEDEVAEKVKAIAKLQTKINRLSLDNSREAQAERVKLEEEMAELQKELSDTQRDHAIEAQKDSLDQMQKDYNAQKDNEIDVLKDTISSYEKLYDMALDYIGKNWNNLYGELVAWNHEYGNTIQEEITSEWDKAALAVQRYGSYVNAVHHFNQEEYGGTSSGFSSSSSASSSSGTQNSVIGVSGAQPLSPAAQSAVEEKVSKMKLNSEGWKVTPFEDNRTWLEDENNRLSKEVEKILGVKLQRGKDGVWYLPDGRKLYDVYGGKFHTGGIVGGQGSFKENEVLAKLEKGEYVLNGKKKDGLMHLMDFVSLLSKQFDRIAANADGTKLFGGPSSWLSEAKRQVPGNVSSRSENNIDFGDVYIYGGSEETVEKHREVTRKMANEVLEKLNIKR